MRALLLAFALLGPQADPPPFQSSTRPLSPYVERIVAKTSWRPGCPVPLSDLRVLTVSHWGFDKRVHAGQLVVNVDAAEPLSSAFARLYELRFPVRHMRIVHMYGSKSAYPKDGDVTGVFRCRQAVPSPCTGGRRTGTWSQHAYGRALDLNPVENPYVGCGMTRDENASKYVRRTPIRPGMVTPAVVQAFASVGWRWGGYWTNSKDYMHFSANGH